MCRESKEFGNHQFIISPYQRRYRYNVRVCMTETTNLLYQCTHTYNVCMRGTTHLLYQRTCTYYVCRTETTNLLYKRACTYNVCRSKSLIYYINVHVRIMFVGHVIIYYILHILQSPKGTSSTRKHLFFRILSCVSHTTIYIYSYLCMT